MPIPDSELGVIREGHLKVGETLDLQEDTSLSQSWEIATIISSLPPAIVAIILFV